MTDLKTFRIRVRDPQYRFEQTLAFIAEHYHYTPSRFSNSFLTSEPGQNEGSCKLLGLAQLEGLSLEETLLAFGEHYRSVLNTPQDQDHGNIRALMLNGLESVTFAAPPLQRKASH